MFYANSLKIATTVVFAVFATSTLPISANNPLEKNDTVSEFDLKSTEYDFQTKTLTLLANYPNNGRYFIDINGVESKGKAYKGIKSITVKNIDLNNYDYFLLRYKEDKGNMIVKDGTVHLSSDGTVTLK